MSIDEITTLVRSAAVPPFAALFLYGSYARGDYDESSDIDIIQVTAKAAAPYAEAKINFTCYTAEQLTILAKNGSLFAKHLVLEAVPLVDPDNLLGTLKSIYVDPNDYQGLCRDIKCAIPVVAISEDTFKENSRHYSAAAAYLLRTYAYARAFETGANSFSMRHVADQLGDTRPTERLSDLRRRQEYRQFQEVVDLLKEFTQSEYSLREESLEAFVVNSFGSCELAVLIGLRILARGDLVTYFLIRERART